MPQKAEPTKQRCWICGQAVDYCYPDTTSPIRVGICCVKALQLVNRVLNEIMPKCGLCHPGRDFKP